MQRRELIVNRPNYAPLWQQTLFCLCTITKKSKAVTALQQEDVAVLRQDQKAKAECLQQVQNCTCSAVKPWFRRESHFCTAAGIQEKGKVHFTLNEVLPSTRAPRAGGSVHHYIQSL